MNYRCKYPDLPVGTILKIIRCPNDESNLVQTFRQKASRRNPSQNSRSSISSQDFWQSSEDCGLSCIFDEMDSGSLCVSVSFSVLDRPNSKIEESKYIEKKLSEDTTRTTTSSDVSASIETASATTTPVTENEDGGRISATITWVKESRYHQAKMIDILLLLIAWT